MRWNQWTLDTSLLLEYLVEGLYSEPLRNQFPVLNVRRKVSFRSENIFIEIEFLRKPEWYLWLFSNEMQNTIKKYFKYIYSEVSIFNRNKTGPHYFSSYNVKWYYRKKKQIINTFLLLGLLPVRFRFDRKNKEITCSR